jgi:hypothetical protein
MKFSKKVHTESYKFGKMKINQHSNKISATHIRVKQDIFAMHYISMQLIKHMHAIIASNQPYSVIDITSSRCRA